MTRTPSPFPRPTRPRRPSTRSARPGHPRKTTRRTTVAGSVLALAVGGAALVVLPGGEAPRPVRTSAAATVVAHDQVRPTVIAVSQPPRAVRRASRGGARTALPPVRYVTRTVAVGASFTGRASWYGGSFQGQRTANGERFDTGELTAASKTLAFGTRLRVCRHSQCVVVRINDRGPYVAGRVLDLTRAARDALGYDGVATVTATPIGTRKVAVRRPAVHGAARPAPARPAPVVAAAAAVPASPLPASPLPASPVPVLAADTTSRSDDAPAALIASALLVLGAGPVVRARLRRTAVRS